MTSSDEQAARATLRVANLFAEAMAKDQPSAEAKDYTDTVLMREAGQVAHYGDLHAAALDLALEKFWLGYVTKAAVKLRVEQMKQELGYAAASPVEQLLIEHTVLCHARLGMVEQQHTLATRGSHSTDSGLYWDRRLTLAQKRFDRAITTLARTRALLARADAARAMAERAASANKPRAGLRVA